MKRIEVNNPLVSVDWLFKNFEAENLIILDATIAKVGKNSHEEIEKRVIKNARFFDIKNVFSDKDSKYPNTVLSAKKFEIKAQALGVNQDSCIVVYDDLGMYSSPRVWWMFRLMGFNNIAVLNGGLPAWEKESFSIEKTHVILEGKGDFKANIQPKKIKDTTQVLLAIKNEEFIIADARSEGRFFATETEPRKEIRGGHIPNSVSLPYINLLKEGKMKSIASLSQIFKEINPKEKELIFSCGSGITACVLALGAALINNKNYSVYDGSWTEWGSRKELPIEK